MAGVERGQEVEVVQGEAIREHRGVHVDDPDDVGLVPERRAQGAADTVEADGVARSEARIDHGVRGQDRDAVLGDPVRDGLREQDLLHVRETAQHEDLALGVETAERRGYRRPHAPFAIGIDA